MSGVRSAVVDFEVYLSLLLARLQHAHPLLQVVLDARVLLLLLLAIGARNGVVSTTRGRGSQRGRDGGDAPFSA